MRARWTCECRGFKEGIWRTYHGLDGGFKILLDALTVEYVVALRLDSIFSELVAETTHSAFSCFVCEEDSGIVLAAQNKVRMASHLTHTREPGEMVSNAHPQLA